GDEADQLVVTSAADDLGRAGAGRVVNLEHEAGIVVEPPAEVRGEAHPLRSDAVAGETLDALLEDVDRPSDIELLAAGKRAECLDRGRWAAGNREGTFEHFGHARARRRARCERCLVEEAFGAVAGGAAADRLDARERQKILDDLEGVVVVGTIESGEQSLVRRPLLAAAGEPSDKRPQPRRVAET